MQGLRSLYAHTGRRAEWKRLVDEIVPDFVGVDDLPRAGREVQWSLVTQYRVWLAEEARDWNAAERLQRVRVDSNRRRAAALLARLPETLTAGEKNTLRTLAVSVSQLANILREQSKPECVEAYQEDYEISLKIGDEPGAAVTAFNLGHAYLTLPALRDLDEAERWYRRILELVDKNDHLGQGKGYYCLGHVAYKRFIDARKADAPQAELLQHLNAAVEYYQQALALLPPDAVDDLAVTHNQLGSIYGDIKDMERALYHYNESIRYKEMAGNLYAAGTTCFNLAIDLANNGRLSDALLYARAALCNFEPYGKGAAEDIQKTQGLIAKIEQAMEKK